MQKIINVLAVASAAVSVAVVGSGIYVYVNRASIIDGVKSQVMDAVIGSLGDLGGLGGASGGALPLGSTDLDVYFAKMVKKRIKLEEKQAKKLND